MTDKVVLVFVGQSVQLVRKPVAAGVGPLLVCGVGWRQEMSRAMAEKIVGSRPDMFAIQGVSND